MRKRSPPVVGRTVPGAPSVGRRTASVPRATPPPHPPLRCVSAGVGWLRTFSVTACNRVSYGAHGDVRRPAYSIPRAQPAHHLYGRTDVFRPPTPGGRGSPPLRWVVAWVDMQRYCAVPTLHQPLSHGAERRDSSPFRGAEVWAEVCGDGASVYRDADAYVSLTPVRGGVPDAPRSCDRRGGLDASVWRDQSHPRYPRHTRLRSPLHVSYLAGAARAPFGAGVGPTSSVIRRKGRRGRRPLRWVLDIRCCV